MQRLLLALVVLVPFACADGAPPSGIDEVRTVEVGGELRRYLLVVPDEAVEPMPLVVVFHGFAGSAEQVRELSGFAELAAEEGFAVAFPLGAGLVPAWRTDAVRAAPDVDFVRELLVDVAGVIDIDSDRVYAAGMSNGGGMAGRLACDASDVIAAIGAVAAAHGSGACEPGRPVPVIAFHGDADPIVPIEGIPLIAQDPREWTAARADANGCLSQPQRASVAPDAERLSWAECGADVAFYIVIGGGHGWPGSGRARLTGDSTTGIDATLLMWDFFAAHPNR